MNTSAVMSPTITTSLAGDGLLFLFSMLSPFCTSVEVADIDSQKTILSGL
jgi:hypothetical protein